MYVCMYVCVYCVYVLLDFLDARTHINHTRRMLDRTLTALVGEGYTRAYRVCVCACVYVCISAYMNTLHASYVNGSP